MTGQALQCVRVDSWPNRTGRTGLPTVSDGSTTTACTTCRQQVWVSKPARNLIAKGELRPICEICKPANTVYLTPET